MSALGIVAADLGGTNIRTGLVIEREVQWSERVPTPAAEGAEVVLAALAQAVARAVDRARSEGIVVVAVGVGTAGVVDSERGTVTSATDIIPGWTGAQVGRVIGAVTGLPVAVLNDVHAHALGEALAGAGRGHRHVLMVTVGTGIGGAQVVDGAIVSGAHGVAGHIGHVPVAQAAGVRCPCGKIGHVEGVASGIALPARFAAAGGREGLTASEIIRLAEHGEGDSAVADDWRIAREVVDSAADGVGDAIGGVVNVLDPSCVILGGGMAVSGTRWWQRTTSAVASQLLLSVDRHPVVAPALGEHAALVGAAIAAEAVTGRIA
jgi:glucokinase